MIVVKRIIEPIRMLMAILTLRESTIRSRKRQIEIFVSSNVMKVWIQSAQPMATKFRLWDG